jgi:cyclic dehypoxanthinyl futalosine synthase
MGIASTTSLSAVFDKAHAGERVFPDEAVALFGCQDLVRLGRCASALARKKNDQVVSYIVDRNINYTNICTAFCHFCAFCRREDAPDAYVLSYEEIERKIAEMVALGGTQVLLQGGLHPTLPFQWYLDLIEALKKKFPQVVLHAFSPPELLHLARISGLKVEEVITALKEGGWESMPGGGAEILCEEVRLRIGNKKGSAREWLEVMERCHEQGVGTTATMMFGHVETPEQRVEHLTHIRQLQDRTKGFRAFIPWIFQPGNNPLGGEIPHKATAFDYLRTLAISRIFLDNVRNIQGSWVTMGEKVGQLSLWFGANDLGSTMIEENVVAAAGCVHRLDERDMVRLVKDAGFVPRKRDSFYSYQQQTCEE